MSVRARNNIATFLKYVVLIAVGFVMIYPLLWMIGATFKTNNEIFSGIGIFPKNPTIQGYIDALNNYGGDIDIIRSMINTYSYVIPKVIFTVISSFDGLRLWPLSVQGQKLFLCTDALYAVFAASGAQCAAVFAVQ